MASLVGQPFPEDVSFMYVPYTPEKSELNACGLPIKYDASKGMSTNPPVITSCPSPAVLQPSQAPYQTHRVG